METLHGHHDEVLDICFNSTGTRLVTASADATARVYNVHTGAAIGLLEGTYFLNNGYYWEIKNYIINH